MSDEDRVDPEGKIVNEKEVTVARTSDLAEGEMKMVEANDTKILLAKVDGEFFAVGGSCTHYGAPLPDGVLSDKRVVCPWHHAAFDVKTGECEEPPALDCLPTFEVRLAGEEIRVIVPDKVESHRTPEMASLDAARDNRTFAIIGAGAAANAAAQALREDGFRGRIMMVTHEQKLPYDRPNLSKDYLQGTAEPEWMPLRPKEFYEDHGIEVKLGQRVKSLDTPSNSISLENGGTIEYDKVLIASGCVPRTLDVPGSDLDNVFTLRSYADSDAIIAAAKDAGKAVVIGASFIGMETALSLGKRDIDVTVVAPDDLPFERVYGPEIGEMFMKLHEEAGTHFKLGRSVNKFEGDGSVSFVMLDNDEQLEADFVVVGIGVKPATNFIKGVELADDGGVVVDDYFTASENVYAAGDIAHFSDWRTKLRGRIEHWRTAQQQGRQAAHNMVRKDVKYTAVPFFWTMHGDVAVGYVGHAAEWDETIIKGDVAKRNFLVFYIKNNSVHAVAGCGRDKELATVHELLRRGLIPSIDKLRDPSLNLSTLIK